MATFKDKVSERFSRMFTNPPTSPSPAVDDENPQVRLYSEGTKLLSSYFSNVIPSAGGSGSRSYESVLSPPLSIGNSHSRNGSLDTFEDCRSSGVNGTENDDDPASFGIASGSEAFKEANVQSSPEKQLAYLMDDSVFISSDLHEFLLSSLPNIVKGCQWALLYSTEKHGISLRTLIRKSAEVSGPCLLIAGDMQGAVFGGLLEAPLKPTAKRKYQGTNQEFVFTTIYGQPRLFRPTGANRYYYMCLNDLLAFGGGGNFAICLDGELLNGTSRPCETFGNSCLAHKPDFELKNVELWGFTHASRYVS